MAGYAAAAFFLPLAMDTVFHQSIFKNPYGAGTDHAMQYRFLL
jgi:hypothetical protein